MTSTSTAEPTAPTSRRRAEHHTTIPTSTPETPPWTAPTVTTRRPEPIDAGRSARSRPGHRAARTSASTTATSARSPRSPWTSAQRDHRAHRPVGLRQVHGASLAQPDERPHRRRPRRGHDHLPRPDIYGKDVDPIEVRRRIGMVFQKPNPFPKSIYDNVAYGPRVTGMKVSNMDDLVEEALRARRALGRGQGQAQAVRLRPVRRAAAAPVHRPHHRRQARGHPHGRALLGARPDRHRPHRGPHASSCATTTRSSSSPTTCSRPPASPTAPPSSPPRPPRTTGDRTGQLVEFDRTTKIFSNPSDTRTEDYISGRFG